MSGLRNYSVEWTDGDGEVQAVFYITRSSAELHQARLEAEGTVAELRDLKASAAEASAPSEFGPVDQAAYAIGWWWQSGTVRGDETGTPSRELYDAFVRFCAEHPQTRDLPMPSETAWGRALSEIYMAEPRHTARGKRRPLRLVSSPADGLGVSA